MYMSIQILHTQVILYVYCMDVVQYVYHVQLLIAWYFQPMAVLGWRRSSSARDLLSIRDDCDHMWHFCVSVHMLKAHVRTNATNGYMRFPVTAQWGICSEGAHWISALVHAEFKCPWSLIKLCIFALSTYSQLIHLNPFWKFSHKIKSVESPGPSS